MNTKQTIKELKQLAEQKGLIFSRKLRGNGAQGERHKYLFEKYLLKKEVPLEYTDKFCNNFDYENGYTFEGKKCNLGKSKDKIRLDIPSTRIDCIFAGGKKELRTFLENYKGE